MLEPRSERFKKQYLSSKTRINTKIYYWEAFIISEAIVSNCIPSLLTSTFFVLSSVGTNSTLSGLTLHTIFFVSLQSRKKASKVSFVIISNAGRTTVDVGADWKDKDSNLRMDERTLLIDFGDDTTDVRKDGGNGGVGGVAVSVDVSVVDGTTTPIRRKACQNFANLQLSNSSAQLITDAQSSRLCTLSETKKLIAKKSVLEEGHSNKDNKNINAI